MQAEYQLINLKTVDSTNRFLKDYVSEQQPTNPVVCITQEQTAGYGQQGREWHTNSKSAIFSIAYPIATSNVVSGLTSLQVARLLHHSLGELIPDSLFLKWPNDLFNSDGKVAGILIEQVIHKGYRALIIGIGINREHPNLYKNAGGVTAFDTASLIANLMQHFDKQGLIPESADNLLEYWKHHNFFEVGEVIDLITTEEENRKQRGTYCGINNNGQVLIKINDALLPLSSGVNSIRKVH